MKPVTFGAQATKARKQSSMVEHTDWKFCLYSQCQIKVTWTRLKDEGMRKFNLTQIRGQQTSGSQKLMLS